MDRFPHLSVFPDELQNSHRKFSFIFVLRHYNLIFWLLTVIMIMADKVAIFRPKTESCRTLACHNGDGIAPVEPSFTLRSSESLTRIKFLPHRRHTAVDYKPNPISTVYCVLYSTKHMKHVNTLCGQNAVFLSVLKKVSVVLTTVGSMTFVQS